MGDRRLYVAGQPVAAARRWLSRGGQLYSLGGKDILQIPASAVFRDGEGWAVFAVERGRAVKRSVQLGQRTGLQAGDSVISHPDDRVRDGVPVVAR